VSNKFGQKVCHSKGKVGQKWGELSMLSERGKMTEIDHIGCGENFS
jgi:hypothetical protein